MRQSRGFTPWEPIRLAPKSLRQVEEPFEDGRHQCLGGWREPCEARIMVQNVLIWLLENSEYNTWIYLKNFPGQQLRISTRPMQIPRKIFEGREIIQPSSLPLMVAILS